MVVGSWLLRDAARVELSDFPLGNVTAGLTGDE